MSETEALTKQVAQLISTVEDFRHMLASVLGMRLSTDQLAERMGIHRNTLRDRLTNDPLFPRPDQNRKWLLSEVMEWEQQQRERVRRRH